MKIFTAWILQLTIIFITRIQNYECGKAAEKCKEYSKAVYVVKDSPVLTMDSGKNTESECGIVSVPLIIGGKLANKKEFPHMALIGFGQSPSSALTWDCGGSLISDSYVLTAAHCLNSREFGPSQKVQLGAIHLGDSDPDVVEKTIVEKISHPKYSRSSKLNDIALIKLDSPVQFTGSIRPACLNTEHIRPGRKALASGFGKLKYDAEDISKNLMKVTLNIYDGNKCATLLPGGKSDSIICAGELKGGKDTCQGDSGGPLQVVLTEPYCMYNIIGVTSFGKFCGFPNSPGIYTNVADYVPWIEEIVWK